MFTISIIASSNLESVKTANVLQDYVVSKSTPFLLTTLSFPRSTADFTTWLMHYCVTHIQMSEHSSKAETKVAGTYRGFDLWQSTTTCNLVLLFNYLPGQTNIATKNSKVLIRASSTLIRTHFFQHCSHQLLECHMFISINCCIHLLPRSWSNDGRVRPLSKAFSALHKGSLGGGLWWPTHVWNNVSLSLNHSFTI